MNKATGYGSPAQAAKEYLSQAMKLDDLIDSSLRDIAYWRGKASTASGSSFDVRYNPNRPTEAPFVRCIEEIDEIQRNTAELAEQYIKLRYEISRRINLLEDPDERRLLRRRYIDGYTWKQIQDALHVSERTAFRIHDNALAHFPMPDKKLAVNAG